jgi:spoIIIJ-associated protein
VPEEASAEGAGLTLGEAKWAAVRQLGRRFPGLSADQVEFEVIADPEQGGGEARVLAHADLEAWREGGGDSAALPEDPVGRVRALVEQVVIALDLRASVEIAEDAEEIRANVVGEDLGLFIGKHGQTIDAVQQLAFRAALQGGSAETRKRVVIDAAGYRERREAALRRQGDQAADDALRFGRPVALDAMGSIERRVVHEHLRERGDVQTYSEGEEPDRHLVVAPLAP